MPLRMRWYALLLFGSIITLCDLNGQAPVAVITTNSESNLIPEGIAYDHRTQTFYVSSINRHKIIAFDSSGKTRDFVRTGQDGFLEGLGMKTDTLRNLLWVASVARKGRTSYSRIHAFDLTTGKTKYQTRIQDTLPHLFNDLVISHTGDVYITDTYFQALYKIDGRKKKLTLLLKDTMLAYPNGLDFDSHGRLLIATYGRGIVQMDASSKRLTVLPGIRDTTISKGLDGLVFYNNTLTGVYNAGPDRTSNAIVQYTLNQSCDSVVSERMIDKAHAAFNDPTTAVRVQDRIYVLANSFLNEFNGNKMSTDGIAGRLSPVVVVAYDLKGGGH